MTITIEPATIDHTQAIAQVMAQVWPDEAVNPAQIALALSAPDHSTHVATTAAGQVAGFVDGFVTLATDGTRRWEVDLLAVAPACQGQKIGQRLVAAAAHSARQHHTSLTRALIQIENRASQIAFQRCGYTTDRLDHVLAISADASHRGDSPIVPAHLIPVTTMRYSGLWLEGEITAAGLAAAQMESTRRGLDIAGVLLPATAHKLLAAAQAADYTLGGHYHWWHRRIP